MPFGGPLVHRVLRLHNDGAVRRPVRVIHARVVHCDSEETSRSEGFNIGGNLFQMMADRFFPLIDTEKDLCGKPVRLGQWHATPMLLQSQQDLTLVAVRGSVFQGGLSYLPSAVRAGDKPRAARSSALAAASSALNCGFTIMTPIMA